MCWEIQMDCTIHIPISLRVEHYKANIGWYALQVL